MTASMQVLALAVTALGLVPTLPQGVSSSGSRPQLPVGGPDFKDYRYDDGTPEYAFGFFGDFTTVWLQYFDPIGSADTIVEILVMNGAQSNGAPVGSVGGVALWDDPNDDADPSDCVLLAQATWTVQSVGQGVFEAVPIAPTKVTSGFFIGAWMFEVGFGSTAALDATTPSLGRAWIDAVPTAQFDPKNLAGSPGLQPISVLMDGVWCLRATGMRQPIAFCTSKGGLACGLPAISAAGTSSATATSGFQVLASPARACKQGILVYNTSKLASGLPFHGGTLCVTPTQSRRAGPTDSGGTPGGASCDGLFAIDMNAFAQGLWLVPDCAGSPSGLPPNAPAPYLTLPGQDVYCQFWGRDSVATGSFVSDGLHYAIGP